MTDSLARDVSLNYQLPIASLITVKLILIALFDAYKSKRNGNSMGQHVGSRIPGLENRYAAIWTPIWRLYKYSNIFVVLYPMDVWI